MEIRHTPQTFVSRNPAASGAQPRTSPGTTVPPVTPTASTTPLAAFTAPVAVNAQMLGAAAQKQGGHVTVFAATAYKAAKGVFSTD